MSSKTKRHRLTAFGCKELYTDGILFSSAAILISGIYFISESTTQQNSLGFENAAAAFTLTIVLSYIIKLFITIRSEEKQKHQDISEKTSKRYSISEENKEASATLNNYFF